MKAIIWLMIAAGGLLGSAPALSQKKVEASPLALRGVSQVGVHIEFEGPADSRDGLTPDQLRSEILLRLKIAGLKVLDDLQPRKGDRCGELYLHVRTIPLTEPTGRADTFCYTLSLDLFQNVTIASEPRISTTACTWSEGSSIVAPRSELRSVTEMVGELAVDFANAFDAAHQIQVPEIKAAL